MLRTLDFSVTQTLTKRSSGKTSAHTYDFAAEAMKATREKHASLRFHAAKIDLDPQIREDFNRFIEQLLDHEVETPEGGINAIIFAMELLELGPLDWARMRWGSGRTCLRARLKRNVALHQYIEGTDLVFSGNPIAARVWTCQKSW